MHKFVALAACATLFSLRASAAPHSSRAKADLSKANDFVVKRPAAVMAFPKTKASNVEDEHLVAKLAYFTCRGGDIVAKSPEAAQQRCEARSQKRAKQGLAPERCRCTGRHAIGVYGPYRYKNPKNKEFFGYTYEGTDGLPYTRKAEGYTP